MTIRVGAVGFDDLRFAALTYLLYPYKVELTRELDDTDVVICKGALPDSSKPLIRLLGGLSNGAQLLDQGNEMVDLPSDPIDSSSKTFEAAMNPSVALRYRLATRLPFSYDIIPSPIRDRLLRMHAGHSGFDLSRYLTIETSRRIITEAFSLLGFALQRKYPPSLVITHDIETAKGLQKAVGLKKVEEQLEVESTWFLPSDEYQLNGQLTRELSEGSIIGSHDTKHDGKLIQVQKHNDLVRRLRSSRLRLEQVIGKTVDCFRSPLLQFSRRIIRGLGEAGYRKDFSAPTWEPTHPATLGGFGVGSVHAFEVDGIVEVPLTLTQDHQVFNVLGLSPRKATKFWTEQAKLVRSMGGDIVLLVHPDYLLSQDLPEYRRLLDNLLEVHLNRSQADQKGLPRGHSVCLH
jgi:peptidoglycan/xylan/chitin deacetylase (PgdA/CDA1 family)